MKLNWTCVKAAVLAVQNKQWGLLFNVLMAAAIVFDLFLVLVLHTTSISLATWIATKTHPTLIAAGILATVWTCGVLKDNWKQVMFAGLMGGHLFIHW